MIDPLVPEHPHDAGVPEQPADRAHIEGAHMLANEARTSLKDLGFTDDEILEWADTYLETESSGDAEDFLAWVAQQEEKGT